MSKKSVKDILDKKLDTTWNQAIADAERMIEEARAKIRKLRGSILVFRERRDSGEPFPCRQSARAKRVDENLALHTERITTLRSPALTARVWSL